MVMRVAAIASLVASASLCASCAATTRPLGRAPDIALVGASGEAVDVGTMAHGERLEVLVFFSRHCHCLDAHEPRLREIVDAYRPRGVEFAMVDAEIGASVDQDQAEARKRGYTFPILIDPGADLADRLGAQYATYTVVIDASGRVRYHGGLDTDKTHLKPDATPFLKNALDDLLAGREPRLAEGKTLGCALQKW